MQCKRLNTHLVAEKVLPSVSGRDKAKALCGIKPFNGSKLPLALGLLLLLLPFLLLRLRLLLLLLLLLLHPGARVGVRPHPAAGYGLGSQRDKGRPRANPVRRL